MLSAWNAGHHDQCYIGWKIEVLVSKGIVDRLIGNTTVGVRMFWERMGYGDSLREALEYTSTHGSAGMLRAMWGPNGLPDFGDEQGDDNIFIRGLGSINVNYIELDP